jgi:error-prone DNA polymerase
MTPPYTELQATSHFSFLRGASSPEDLFVAAHGLGHSALGITDWGSLAGIVRAHQAANATGLKLVVGARVDLDDAPPLLLYPADRAGYSKLCRLLTLGKSRAGKGGCRLAFADVAAHGEGLLAILLSDAPDDALAKHLCAFRESFGDRAYLALTRRFRPGDDLRLEELADLGARARVPTIVTGDVLYHEPERRILQDVVTCIRLGITIEDAGFRRERFTDRHLKSPQEMVRLFVRHPEAVARTQEIVERCRFSLSELRYQYPHEVSIPGLSAQQALEKFTWEASAKRYPRGVPEKVERQLKHELQLIGKMDYAPYFLTVYSIVHEAREKKKILCQGRGSAANSAVCFVLGITSIDPQHFSLLFERFVSPERKEPPDIDVDFEHERREEIIQWIYETYGRHRAALCATVIRYRARGALRDVGKVMGVPEDVLKGLSGLTWGWGTEGVSEKEARELNLNLADRRLRLTLQLARALIGVPRHLSQHPGGFVLTEERLDDLVPIEPAAMDKRQVIEWDKDDIDELKFMKVDVLGLGMLGCMRRAFDLLAAHKGERLDLAGIPPDDKQTYAMIQKADTIGVFQIESRAQMSMLPRLKPKEFYDLVIQVAIVRPGPIQGDMVHPYLRRREGKEKPEYPSAALEEVLKKTLGVPLFQEQAMQVAIVGAGFTPSEADQLRRAMATFKNVGTIGNFRKKLIDGMVERQYSRDFAERTFKQLEGFGSYGFPESHAASFALIAYASSWMKCHHPDVFCCALVNAQPMGFYALAQIVRDAREHGVEVRAVDVNVSEWDCTLEAAKEQKSNEDYRSVRLGLRLAKGLSSKHGERIAKVRKRRPFASVEDLWRRAGVPVAALERLADADAFGSLGLSRRQALWAIHGLRDAPLPLFAAADGPAEPAEQDEPVSPVPPPPAERSSGKGTKLISRAAALLDCFPSAFGPAGNDNLPTAEEQAGNAEALAGNCSSFSAKAEDPGSSCVHKAGSSAFTEDDETAEFCERERGPDLSSDPTKDEAAPGLAESPQPEYAPEIVEPAVDLVPMTAGREVVEDFRSTGLTLRRHPVSFLRDDLARAKMLPTIDVARAHNGRRMSTAGLVLVRQRPGSAQGVIFITLEDEFGIANLVVWPSLFERQRRIVLSASMLGVRGRVQRAGEVVHLVAEHFVDLSGLLRSVGERDEDFPLPHGSGDEARTGGGPDSREPPGRKPRDLIPDPTLSSGIKIPTRDFR